MDEAELRRLARKTGFDLATLEKDYALTWLLNGVYSEESKLRNVLIFPPVSIQPLPRPGELRLSC